jgi:hypothetical protein
MAASAPQTNSTATVTVACKLPHGLILRVFEMEEIEVQLLNGPPKKVKQAKELAKRFFVNGFSHAQNRAPDYEIVGGIPLANGTPNGGYALTPGVPKDLWDLWWEQNKTSAMARNGLIWAMESRNDVGAKAADGAKIKSGLERMDPEHLPAILANAVKTDKEAMRARVNNLSSA